MGRKNSQYSQRNNNNQRYQVQQPVNSRGKNPLTPLWFIISIAVIILAQNFGWFEGMMK